MLDQITPRRPLDVLCPMHVEVCEDGRILHVGPTVAKLCTEGTIVGTHFLDAFTLLRPKHVRSMQDLVALDGKTVHLRFDDEYGTPVKAVVVPGGEGDGSFATINMSFGIAIVDAVGRYKLTNADFAGTDLTIEMLYLVEAKSAAMEESRDLNTRLRGAMIAAEEQAFTDTLTGLKNRRAMDLVLSRKLGLGDSFACMHLDLDYFKAINDTYGHAAGDHVLQVAAQVLVDETRAQDTIARVGGDEFVLLIDQIDDPDRISQIATRMIARLEEPVPFNGHVCRISGSSGSVHVSQIENPTAEALLHAADVALYASKGAGRGRHTVFSPELLSLDITAPTGERGAARPPD